MAWTDETIISNDWSNRITIEGTPIGLLISLTREISIVDDVSNDWENETINSTNWE